MAKVEIVPPFDPGLYSSTFQTVKKGKISVLSDTQYLYPIQLCHGHGRTLPTFVKSRVFQDWIKSNLKNGRRDGDPGHAALRAGAAHVIPRGLLLGGQAGAAGVPTPAAAAALVPPDAFRDGAKPEKGRRTTQTEIGILKFKAVFRAQLQPCLEPLISKRASLDISSCSRFRP